VIRYSHYKETYVYRTMPATATVRIKLEDWSVSCRAEAVLTCRGNPGIPWDQA